MATRIVAGGESVKLRMKSQSLLQTAVRRELKKQSGGNGWQREGNGTDTQRGTEQLQDGPNAATFSVAFPCAFRL